MDKTLDFPTRESKLIKVSMLDYWHKKIKGFLRPLYIYMGIIVVLLFIFVSLSGKSDLYLANISEIIDVEGSEKDNSFIGSMKRFLPESPEFLLIENSTLKASSPPTTFSPQVLGALVAGYEPEDTRMTITEHIIGEGDTLSSLAVKFNISLDTILWANDLNKNSILKLGQKLVILPVSGIVHYVKSGDTVSEIAKIYKGETAEIVAFNQLADENDIYIGDIIIVPDGVMPPPVIQKQQIPASLPLASSYFIVPISSPYIITQGLHWYNAVDLSQKGNACGKPVFAAAGGTIQKIGQDRQAGNYVRILHPNELITFYGHLSSILVSPGQPVSQGQIIGHIGNTGYTVGLTGCHLHFEVRGARNPFAQ